SEVSLISTASSTKPSISWPTRWQAQDDEAPYPCTREEHSEGVEVTMYPTRNDLPESARIKLVELLNARLADAIDLQTQCKQAHWNVKGPEFIALHKLFDEVNDAVEEYVDLIAERAVQLGGVDRKSTRLNSSHVAISYAVFCL